MVKHPSSAPLPGRADGVSPGGRDPLGIAAGLAPLLLVLAVFGVAESRGLYPSGHPYSELMWAFIGYMTLRRATQRQRGPAMMYWITLGLTMIGGLIWTLATLNGVGQPQPPAKQPGQQPAEHASIDIRSFSTPTTPWPSRES